MSGNNNIMIQQIQDPPKPVSVTGLFGFSALAVAKISIGAVYMDQCPIQPYIPIYLIVFGCFSILVAIISCLPWTRAPSDERTTLGNVLLVVRNLLNTFLFAWLIAGSYWIYSVYDAPGGFIFCNNLLYKFAFWTTTAYYILMCVVMVFCILPVTCMFFCGLLCNPLIPDVDDV